MPSSISSPGGPEPRRFPRALPLWLGILAGPLAWLSLLQWNYVASYVSCETRQTWFLHAATLLALALTAAAGAWAWRTGGGLSVDPREPTEPLGDATRAARTLWMARLAALFSAWFVIVMLAMEVPILILETCQ